MTRPTFSLTKAYSATLVPPGRLRAAADALSLLVDPPAAPAFITMSEVLEGGFQRSNPRMCVDDLEPICALGARPGLRDLGMTWGFPSDPDLRLFFTADPSGMLVSFSAARAGVVELAFEIWEGTLEVRPVRPEQSLDIGQRLAELASELDGRLQVSSVTPIGALPRSSGVPVAPQDQEPPEVRVARIGARGAVIAAVVAAVGAIATAVIALRR